MEDLKKTHAIPVILAVAMLILGLCFFLFAILVSESSIRPFCFAVAFVLGAVSVNKLLDISWYDEKLAKLQKQLSKVNPESCPDYWETSYSKCEGLKCKPYFLGRNMDGEEGTVWMKPGATRDSQEVLKTYKESSADTLCNINKQYPWMEISNECDARNRVG
jgi:hypothetical protein